MTELTDVATDGNICSLLEVDSRFRGQALRFAHVIARIRANKCTSCGVCNLVGVPWVRIPKRTERYACSSV